MSDARPIRYIDGTVPLPEWLREAQATAELWKHAETVDLAARILRAEAWLERTFADRLTPHERRSIVLVMFDRAKAP